MTEEAKEDEEERWQKWVHKGFPGGASGREHTSQCRRYETWLRCLGQGDPWRRAWQTTPVFLPGESHGQRSLAGYSPRGHKELDTTEVT